MRPMVDRAQTIDSVSDDINVEARLSTLSEGVERRRLEGIRCPTCHGHFDLIRILGRFGGSYKLLVRCPSCDVYGIGTAQAQSADASLAISASSNPSRDARSTLEHHVDPISEHDVVAVRDFLDTFNGDFRALWNNRHDN